MSTTTPRPPKAPDIPGLVYVQPLGSGGYADVHLYEQQMPRMPVAVKVLKRQGLTPAIRRQFIEEANTMAELADHPYIVQVFRSEQLADGGAYLVMKYYPPPNLAIRAKKERFTVEEVLRTGIQLASAVETAHRAGIIHRDIKPANVLVSQYGAPGLTDFGIAGRGINQDEHDEDVGVSVPWAPPEVLYGQSNGDSRSDVYSLVESPKSNTASFTSVGQPSTPSVTASTPAADETATLTVAIGKPRSGAFQSVSWSSSAGGGGTYSCGACGSGSTVTIKTNVRPTVGQTFTVTTNNGTSTSNPATSNSVTPYGPTPKPRSEGSSANNRNVYFNWSLPTNGRPITRVRITGAESYDGAPITSIGHKGDWDTQYSVNITAYSEAGASPVLTMTRKTGLPDPVLTLSHGREIKNRVDQGCDPPSPCYYAVVKIDNFLGQANCTLHANSQSVGYNDQNHSFTLRDGGTWTSRNYFGYITYPQVTVKCTSAKQSKQITRPWRNP